MIQNGPTSWGKSHSRILVTSKDDPYRGGPTGHNSTPNLHLPYVLDPMELDEHVPVYVLEPEHLEYHAPSDDDIQLGYRGYFETDDSAPTPRGIILARLENTETHLSRMEWQRQRAEDDVVRQMMRTHVLEAIAQIDTVDDTDNSYPFLLCARMIISCVKRYSLYRDIRLEIDVVRGQRTAYEIELHEVRQAYLSFEARNRALLARLKILETHMSRIEWKCQRAKDDAVRQMMHTYVLEARAQIDTVEDTGSSC
ncbi:hypothetical protein Tco_0097320 [Tanacetum coccineum]